MARDQTVVLLVSFFQDEYADNQKGVDYWLSQNFKGDSHAFLTEIDQLKLELTPAKESGTGP